MESKNKEHRERITVRLKTSLYEELKRRAQLAHMSMNAYVEMVLEERWGSKAQS
ncbi:MAG: toxin-antitoxin system HicB family antitoxin [Bacteroidales bacterium]|nr:toxin-antitoxin system HicB family antitoxin [Bacteroidales bacterium]